jgi:mannose-1-phosphate guanylyltransferase
MQHPKPHYYAMIVAGGGGTRLWPLSRRNMPKQLLPLTADHSMFKASVDRLLPLFPPEHIYVVTGAAYAGEMQAEVPMIPADNFVIEPSARDNAAAAALGIAVISKRDPEATIAFLTADHHIAKRERFLQVLTEAYDLAQADRVVTLGITPSYPSTGFGYIHQGRPLAAPNGHAPGFVAYESLGFKEKPDLFTAMAFLAEGDYTWNSGMFIWRARKALAEFARQQPEMYAAIQRLLPAIDTPDYTATLDAVWETMPRKSIDFAIMEGAKAMAVIPVDIGWSDIGSWASLFEVLDLDEFGNSFRGRSPDRIIRDTHNTLVVSDRLAVVIGVEDLIIVDTEDALMICHKDRSQEVREVVRHLRETNQEHYL